jgi:outer membrane receptor for ferrienterochelin and colicin
MKYIQLFLFIVLFPNLVFGQSKKDTLKNKSLREVKVTQRNNGNEMQQLNPIRTEKITQVELKKNACCNLAESFETNPSVEVSFTNAVTGARQIQMLGLSGIYVQTMTDILPTVRGLNYASGFSNIPGPFVNSIFINKGPGSVTNGFESMTGQIDIELMKPEKSPRFFINTYVNSRLRTELNTIVSKAISTKLSTVLMTHVSDINNKVDMNNDNYLDRPLYKQAQFINRWKYESDQFECMFGVKGLYDDKLGGDTRFDKNLDASVLQPYYGFNITTKRWEAFTKMSHAFNATGSKSLGLQLSYTNHMTDGFYGRNLYNGAQQSVFANLIYQTPIGNNDHDLRMGGGLLYDNIKERYIDNLHNQQYELDRKEPVVGVFGEYTYKGSEKFSGLVGLRGDYNLRLKRFYFIPRVNLKYSLTHDLAIRASAGSGFRTANILSENAQIFASNRTIQFTEPLLPEYSWNYGFNISYCFREKHTSKEGRISLDIFKTDFVQQSVVDLDVSPQTVLMYNLNGKSYAWYVQAELYKEVIRNLDIRLAYKFNDVRVTQHGVLLEKALNAKHKALFNIAYETRNRHWKFDYTTQWVGKQRLPNYNTNPEGMRLAAYSPTYFKLLCQITYVVKQVDIYAGCENLSNYTQKNILIDGEHPYGNYFDAANVWGPMLGRMFYAGFRYTLK